MTQTSAPRLVAQPDRHRRHRQHGAHGLDLGGQRVVARLDPGEGQAVAGEIAEARHRRAADGASRAPRSAGPSGWSRPWVKGSPRSRMRAMRSSSWPAESAASHVPKARKSPRSAGAPVAAGRLPATSGASPGTRPRHQPLVFLVDQRLGAVERRLELADLGGERRVLAFGAEARAIERHDAEHGEEDRADHRDQGDDLRRARDRRAAVPVAAKAGCADRGARRAAHAAARIPVVFLPCPRMQRTPFSPRPDTRGVWHPTARHRPPGRSPPYSRESPQCRPSMEGRESMSARKRRDRGPRSALDSVCSRESTKKAGGAGLFSTREGGIAPASRANLSSGSGPA